MEKREGRKEGPSENQKQRATGNRQQRKQTQQPNQQK